MAKSWKQRSLTAVSVFVGVIVTGFVGLYVYIAATTKPMHPDPKAVPSVNESAPSQQWTNAAEQGRQIARAGVSEQNLPGLSVAVGVGGEIVWAEGFGWADIDKQSGVTPATRFRMGEVSKALTSAAAGLLVEQKKLNLDAYIQTYVPEFPEKKWPVTVRQLMGHVAGFRDDSGDEAHMEPCAKTEEGLSLFADDALLFEPGTKYRASSYSWILVSAVIEAAAREPFFEYMRKAVFEPLRMTATTPDFFKDQIPDRATFYFPRFAGDTRYGPEPTREGDHSCFAGGGAFLSTAVGPGSLRDRHEQRHAAATCHREAASDIPAVGVRRRNWLRPGLDGRDSTACRSICADGGPWHQVGFHRWHDLPHDVPRPWARRRSDDQYLVRGHEVDCAEDRGGVRVTANELSRIVSATAAG